MAAVLPLLLLDTPEDPDSREPDPTEADAPRKSWRLQVVTGSL